MFKIKIRKSDKLFSDFIKKRDNYICQRCRKKCLKGIACSHYWSRVHEGTRHEPDNCITLCFGCHLLWGHGEERSEYEKFMKKKLGVKRFKTLDIQAHTYKKKDEVLAQLYVKE